MRESAQSRLKVVDKEIAAEKKVMEEDGEEIGGEEEDAWYLRRLDGGLYTLQMVDYILAWILMEDDGVCFATLGLIYMSLLIGYRITLADSCARKTDVGPSE